MRWGGKTIEGTTMHVDVNDNYAVLSDGRIIELLAPSQVKIGKWIVSKKSIYYDSKNNVKYSILYNNQWKTIKETAISIFALQDGVYKDIPLWVLRKMRELDTVAFKARGDITAVALEFGYKVVSKKKLPSGLTLFRFEEIWK